MPLSNYVDSLFGGPADAGPSARPTGSQGQDQGDWQAFIDQWEAEQCVSTIGWIWIGIDELSPDEPETGSEDEPYFPFTPWPSLLDYFKPGESSTTQAPSSPHEATPPLPSGGISPNGLDVDLSLLDRLRM
jgi:hypothetical protein